MKEKPQDKVRQFAKDVDEGLSSTEKYLSSKYFYDERGDRFFQEIMALPEYYLTKCEYEILNTKVSDIVSAIDPSRKCFNVIEMGAGDGYKTRIILKFLLEEHCDIRYMPVDISMKGILKLKDNLKSEFPDLVVEGIAMDYFSALKHIKDFNLRSQLFLFLGSNIGNFDTREATDFLKMIRSACQPGDKLLIGFDLKKDPNLILRAYNDKSGVTKDFNLNLLDRMNRELGANFIRENFIHYPVYDISSGKAKSYLVSIIDQEVYIAANKKKYRFNHWEPVLTEISQKYDLQMVSEFAERSGFRVCGNFSDGRKYFLDSLWEMKND